MASTKPLSVREIATLLGYEYWKVRNAVDTVTRDTCPRIGRYRAVPPKYLKRIREILEAQDARNGRGK